MDFCSYFTTGLVEIAALTTLIGSSTATSLVLGNRGGPGLPWAAMSAFGILSTVKGCVAGASPDWMRAALGVRDLLSDDALGIKLNLRSKYKSPQDLARRDLGRAGGLAVMVPSPKQLQHSPSSDGELFSMVDIYAFDQFVSYPLRSVLSAHAGNMPVVYVFVRDPNYRNVRKADWIGLCVSAAKTLEIFALWRLGTTRICWVAAAPWMHFFLAAIILQALGITKGYRPHAQPEVDVISGELPTPKVPGGSKKILLQMPENFRQSVMWKLTWAIGCLVSVASLLATYILLSKENPNTFYTWLGFQVVWLVLRLVFYHLTDGADHLEFPGLFGREWKHLSSDQNTRALRLLWALARYQTHIHPRGSYSYVEDMKSLDKIQAFLPVLGTDVRTTLPDRTQHTQLVLVVLDAVFGDTLLSSAAWLAGSDLTGMDVYDAVVVVLELSNSRFAVSAVRVLSGTSMQTEIAKAMSDPENSTPRFRHSKGLPNAGTGIFWIYWIPCSDGKWLQLQTEDMQILGQRQATLMTDAQVTSRLNEADMNVSFTTVDDVKNTLEYSRKAAAILQTVLQVPIAK